MAKVHERPIADDNVHVVAPTGAYASYWTDWKNDDPLLGKYKWETFLTTELPDIVKSQLSTTDKSAVGGVSMGGQAAMHLAATHDMYDAVMSFSGNYSTMDPLGYQTLRMTVETRGADVNNMWGPHGSDQWQRNDTISHVKGLDGKGVFFSAGNGVLAAEDLAVYGPKVQDMAVGMVLERGVLEGTTAFEKALTQAGVEHEAVYTPTGAHNWVNFMKNFDAGWNYIKGDLGLAE
jgi:S-formylglutathione hydrolase FrmB